MGRPPPGWLGGRNTLDAWAEKSALLRESLWLGASAGDEAPAVPGGGLTKAEVDTIKAPKRQYSQPRPPSGAPGAPAGPGTAPAPRKRGGARPGAGRPKGAKGRRSVSKPTPGKVPTGPSIKDESGRSAPLEGAQQQRIEPLSKTARKMNTFISRYLHDWGAETGNRCKEAAVPESFQFPEFAAIRKQPGILTDLVEIGSIQTLNQGTLEPKLRPLEDSKKLEASQFKYVPPLYLWNEKIVDGRGRGSGGDNKSVWGDSRRRNKNALHEVLLAYIAVLRWGNTDTTRDDTRVVFGRRPLPGTSKKDFERNGTAILSTARKTEGKPKLTVYEYVKALVEEEQRSRAEVMNAANDKAGGDGTAAGPPTSGAATPGAPEAQGGRTGAGAPEAKLLTDRATVPLAQHDEFILKQALLDAKERLPKRYVLHESGLKMKKYIGPRGPCAECGTMTTSEWRPTDGVELCNACGLRARARKRGVPQAVKHTNHKSRASQKRYAAAMQDIRRETEMLKRENKERERLGLPLLPTKKDLMKIGLMKTPTRGPAGLPRAPAFVDGKLQGQGTTPPAQQSSQKKGSQKKGSQAKGKTPRRAGAADKPQSALAQMPALLHAIEKAQPWPEELLQEAGLASGPSQDAGTAEGGAEGEVEAKGKGKGKGKSKASGKEEGKKEKKSAAAVGAAQEESAPPPIQRNTTEDQTIAEFLTLIKDTPEVGKSPPAQKRGGEPPPQVQNKRAKTKEAQSPTSPWAGVPEAPVSRRGRTPRPSVRLGVPGSGLTPTTPQGALRPEPAAASAQLAFLAGALDQLPSSPKK